jgi:hypothetical protein
LVVEKDDFVESPSRVSSTRASESLWNLVRQVEHLWKYRPCSSSPIPVVECHRADPGHRSRAFSLLGGPHSNSAQPIHCAAHPAEPAPPAQPAQSARPHTAVMGRPTAVRRFCSDNWVCCTTRPGQPCVAIGCAQTVRCAPHSHAQSICTVIVRAEIWHRRARPIGYATAEPSQHAQTLAVQKPWLCLAAHWLCTAMRALKSRLPHSQLAAIPPRGKMAVTQPHGRLAVHGKPPRGCRGCPGCRECGRGWRRGSRGAERTGHATTPTERGEGGVGTCALPFQFWPSRAATCTQSGIGLLMACTQSFQAIESPILLPAQVVACSAAEDLMAWRWDGARVVSASPGRLPIFKIFVLSRPGRYPE